MADTSRGVRWALGLTCLLRSPAHESDIRKAEEITSLARYASESYANNEVLDGLRVTSYTYASGPGDTSYKVPISIRSTETDFAAFGGYEKVSAACRACEANASGKTELLAGCTGFLDVFRPRSEDLERELQTDLDERGLRADYERLFSVTDPMFHGLWINSPLRGPQCDLLCRLFDEPEPDDRDRGKSLAHFRRALLAAVQWELPLHVEMTAPGHTDFGYYTVFAHCPRCKAEVMGRRWVDDVPDSQHVCDVCGYLFSPAKTHSMERLGFDDSERSVENVLGAEKGRAFSLRYIEHQGATPEEAEAALDDHENGPVRRRVDHLLKLLRNRRRSSFGDALTPEQANIRFERGGFDLDEPVSTTPVAAYPANAWGLFDMHGNVREWCEDAWHDAFVGLPTAGAAWNEAEDPSFRVTRGGSCSCYSSACESSSRALLRADAGSRGRLWTESEDDEKDAEEEGEDPVMRLLDAVSFDPVGFRLVTPIAAPRSGAPSG